MFLLEWAEPVTSVEAALFLGTALSPLHARQGGENQPPAAVLGTQLTGCDCWLPACSQPTPSWGARPFTEMYIPAYGCWFGGRGAVLNPIAHT